jgi:folylpolyglutamate synthase
VDSAECVQASDIDRLNIIHVAGTKGKGSTCAFVDKFLECHSERYGFPRKRGLYTSPHLVVPEERIRINSKPLSKSMFAQYFFEVFDALAEHDDASAEPQPRFLQLFFLLALHTFLREGVDAAIIETHHGGEYDATNIVEHPVVTAITSLGMDHVSQLGPSIENIAWHKAGIFKTGAAAFSVVEKPSVAKVLEDRAAAKGATLTFVDVDSTLPRDIIKLQPDVQRLNSSLALAITRSFIGQKDPMNRDFSQSDVVEGIRRFSWPGRFQIVNEKNGTWYLDGAHNVMSVKIASTWFMETSTAQKYGATLVFSFQLMAKQAIFRNKDPDFRSGQ